MFPSVSNTIWLFKKEHTWTSMRMHFLLRQETDRSRSYRQRLSRSYLPFTSVCILGADLCQAISWALVWGVENVGPQQRFKRGADGNEEELSVKITRPGRSS